MRDEDVYAAAVLAGYDVDVAPEWVHQGWMPATLPSLAGLTAQAHILRDALYQACSDSFSDPDGAYQRYVDDAIERQGFASGGLIKDAERFTVGEGWRP